MRRNVNNTVFLDSFGKKLREIRLLKGLSQEDLAFEANTSLSQIGRIERGERAPNINTIFLLSKALSIEPKELFDFAVDFS